MTAVDQKVIAIDFSDDEILTLLESLRYLPVNHPRRGAALRLGSELNTFAVNRRLKREASK